MKALLFFFAVGLQAQVSALVWSHHSPGNGPPAFAGWNSLVPDSVSGQFLFYGLSNAVTQGGIYSTALNWLSLANPANQWSLQPGGTGSLNDSQSAATTNTSHHPRDRHPYSGFPIMDDARQIGVFLGGSNGGGFADMLYFVRHPNPALNDGTFVVMSPGGGVYPNCIQFCGGFYDPDDDVYFVFGYNGGAGQSLWNFCNTMPFQGGPPSGNLNAKQTAYGACSTPDTWHNITPGTVPPNAGELGFGTLQNPSFTWDPFTHKAIMYGGIDATFSAASNQTWSYTPSTNTFLELCGAGCTKPPGAGVATGIISPMMDTNRGYIWIHIPTCASGCPQDAYYSPSTDRWHFFTSNGGETDNYTISAYDPITDKFASVGQAGTSFADSYISAPIGGRVLQSGSGAPGSGTGNDGDLYRRTDTKALYGPKIDGSWPSTFSYFIGVGCTTAYHIDKDCDGYGVGPTSQTVDPNPLFSVDADDNDAAVNTPASVISTWGTISAFLTHLGYPTGTIKYIDPVSGSNSNPGTFASPYLDWTPVITGLSYAGSGAGNTTLLYRGGITGLGNYLVNSHIPYASSPSSPIVIMPYPGERGLLYGITGDSQNLGQSSNVIYDGWTLKCGSLGAGNGFDGNHNDGIILKNMEISGCSHGWQVGSGGQNLVMDGNVFHDTQSHAVYPTSLIYSPTQFNCPAWVWDTTGAPFPSGYNPFTNLTFKNNLVYNAGTGGLEAIHLNALICGGSVTGNFLHNIGGTGLGLQTGIQGQPGNPFLVANNAIFSNQSAAITMSIYGCDNNGSASTTAQYQMGGSCYQSSFSAGTFYNPAFFNYVSIINNTLWTGQYATQGGGQCSPTDPSAPGGQCQIPSYGIYMLDYSVGTPDTKYLKNTTIQNNLILTYNNSVGTRQLQFITNSFPDTDNIKNNMFYNLAPGNSQSNLMFISSDAQSSFPGTYTFTQLQSYNTGNNSGNLFADPLFQDVGLGYYATPNLFNFHLLASSTAIAAGLHAGAPVTDAAGLSRPNPPSIGAYEFSAASCAISPSTLPGGVVGVSYSQALSTSSCGAGPFTWSKTTGTMPPGLALNTSTGAITGIPTTLTGSPFTFNIHVTDGGSNTADQSYTVSVINVPTGVGNINLSGKHSAAGNILAQ